MPGETFLAAPSSARESRLDDVAGAGLRHFNAFARVSPRATPTTARRPGRLRPPRPARPRCTAPTTRTSPCVRLGRGHVWLSSERAREHGDGAPSSDARHGAGGSGIGSHERKARTHSCRAEHRGQWPHAWTSHDVHAPDQRTRIVGERGRGHQRDTVRGKAVTLPLGRLVPGACAASAARRHVSSKLFGIEGNAMPGSSSGENWRDWGP